MKLPVANRWLASQTETVILKYNIFKKGENKVSTKNNKIYLHSYPNCCTKYY